MRLLQHRIKHLQHELLLRWTNTLDCLTITLDSQRLLGLQVGLAAIFGVPYKAVNLEVQDDGLFLIVTIELDSNEPPVAQLTAAAARLLDESVPYYLPIPFWSKVASVLMPVPAFLLGARLHGHAA